MISVILAAVDDSEASFHAADVAATLAAGLGARLEVVSVMADGRISDLLTEHPAGPAQERRLEAAAAALRHVAARATARGLAVRTVERTGRVAEEVLAAAETAHADLIVIARADRRGTGTPYVGSQAQRILEFADVPVLVVPRQPGPPVSGAG